MRSNRRNISVFSISALDLFAAALGAFILIVLVLFPYYQKGGTDESMDELEELVKKRRLVASSTDKQYLTVEEEMAVVVEKIREVQKQTAEIEIPDPPPLPQPDPEPIPEPDPVKEPPRSTNQGVEFSILGLATNRKEANVERALNEILDVMKPDNRFAIIGYRGGPSYDAFPHGGQFRSADAASIDQARRFVSGLPRKFGGGTPTQAAMVRALNMRPEVIILISDGAPDDGSPGEIIANISNRNRARAEIHTVAIGDYTKNKALTVFLQELANRNNGDFVGRAR